LEVKNRYLTLQTKEEKMKDYILMIIFSVVFLFIGIVLLRDCKPKPDKKNPEIVWTSALDFFGFLVGFIFLCLSIILFFLSFGYIPHVL
jgi:uncharacterized membrane protein YfcA